MKKILFILLTFVLCISQIVRIGTNDSELSAYKAEVFESGIVFGLSYDFTLFNIPSDFEIYYSSNNFLNENSSYLVQLQFPLSFRFYLKDKLFLRAGIQYDTALDFKIFNEDFSNYVEDSFSLIYGFGINLKYSNDSDIYVEARYIVPQQNFISLDKGDQFGYLKQFHILLGFKL